MNKVLDEELESWHAAVTEFPPSLSYSLLTLQSNPESLESWRADRQVLFLGLETWPCLMKDEAKVPQLAYELNWDEYDGSAGRTELTSYAMLELEVPVSLVMVDLNGCAVTDIQAVPSPALMTALIPSHQRSIARNLYDASRMEQWLERRNQLTKQALKSLKEATMSFPATP